MNLSAEELTPNVSIMFVLDQTEEEPQFLKKNQERLDNKAQLINDPDTFEDPFVEKEVINNLRHLGVNVELGFEYYEHYGDEKTAC